MSAQQTLSPGDRVTFNAFSTYIAETKGIPAPEAGTEAIITEIEPVSEGDKAWNAVHVLTSEGEPFTTDPDLVDLIPEIPESSEVANENAIRDAITSGEDENGALA